MRNQLAHYLRRLASRIEKKPKPSAVPPRARIVTVPMPGDNWFAYSPEHRYLSGAYAVTEEAARIGMEKQLAALGYITR